MSRPEIQVDKYGTDLSGESFDFIATPQSVAEGLMVNEAVTLVYPDGCRQMATRARITQKGMARLRQEIGGEQ